MSGRKRARKGKEAESSAPPSHSSQFISKEAEERYTQSLASKKVIFGRALNEKSKFHISGLNLRELFQYQGLDKFLGIETKVYPTFVKFFYTNLHHPYDEDINS